MLRTVPNKTRMKSQMRRVAVSPAGSPIVGTLEMMEGTALAEVTLDEKGQLDVKYSGETKADWNSQRTQLSGAERLFVCSDDLIWLESESDAPRRSHQCRCDQEQMECSPQISSRPPRQVTPL
jgi:hypothetical protein